MHLSSFDLFVWAASFVGHILLLFVLVSRHRAAQFPIFTTLITASVARTIALYFVLHHFSASAYYYSYWSMAVVDEVLQFLVFYELAVHVFCPLGVWTRDTKQAFITLLGGSVVVATLLTWLASPATRFNIQAVVLRGNFFSSALLSELFVGILLLSATAGLPWKTHVARIAQGLGAYSLVSVIIDAADNWFGMAHSTQTFMALAHFRILVYLACASYWIVTLWQEAPAPRALPEVMRTQIYSLHRQIEYDLVRVRSWRRS